MSSPSACEEPRGASPAWPARLLLLLVDAYRVALAPILGGHCRFFPSCSLYAQDALRLHGARRGTWLALRRLARCQPFSTGGFDPVPPPAAGRRPSP